MKKIKGARWAWWRWSPGSPHQDEMIMPSVESLAISDSRGGAGKAMAEAVGNAEEVKEVVAGPPPDGSRALTTSRSQRGGEGSQHAVGGTAATGRWGFVEGRRSVSSHVDQANAARVAASLRVKVIAADMPDFMQVHAFRCARRSYDGQDKFSSKQMAHDIKKEFDKVYGSVWHCVIGSSFGSFVTHSKGCFLSFSMENLLVLLFKTRISKAAAA
ncbi:hypothetical protein Taro_049578 [Colocasia esculenta]|uniref:Dynein light chain n=1 Tax=Colocasia esculenta TaxID=4460 RepID=A0A843XB87_COLES|nr:hypothetical protein [Colocasia esculenta]